MTKDKDDSRVAADADQDKDEASRDQNKNSEPKPAEDDLPPAGNRGETSDNLGRRSDWFQKRTGGR